MAHLKPPTVPSHMAMTRRIGIALSAAALTACGPSSEPTPAPVKAAPVAPNTQGPMPAPPAWAAPYLGKIITETLPEGSGCIGNTEGVPRRFAGPPAGAEISGWGWDSVAKRRVERILLADESLRIIGAGDGGVDRPDVLAVKPEFQDGKTGWVGRAPITSGLVIAYALVDGGKAACPLGEIEV